MEKYTEQELNRRESLKELETMGINAYPAEEFVVNTDTQKIKNNFKKTNKTTKKTRIAGRIMSRRIMGKASFVELKDSKGRIQIYINRDELCQTEDKSQYNTVFKKH